LSNKIPFPKNYDRFIELGKEAIGNDNLNEAINYFQKAYDIQQNFALNFLLVNTYLDLGENEQALYWASERKEDYLTCTEYIEVYVQVLVQNQKFIQAHCIINERILLEKSGEMKALISLKKKVRHVELMYQQFETKKIKEIKTELEEMESHTYQEQLMIVRQSLELPQDEFIAIGKKILINTRICNLIRSFILEEFAKLHIKEKIEFLWRDKEIHEIVPAVVGPPLDCAAYQRILLFLEKELIDNDPILFVNLLEEIRLHFAILYPLSDEYIKDPKLWAISYLITYNPEYSQKYQLEINQEEVETIQSLQTEIRSELAMMSL